MRPHRRRALRLVALTVLALCAWPPNASPWPALRPPRSGMVFVPAGVAVLGTDEAEAHDLAGGRDELTRRIVAFERPKRSVPMPAYWIDVGEVTNAQYLRFLEDAPSPDRRMPDHWRDGRPAPGDMELPVRFVSYHDTAAFAEWAGKHVPTEEEWEYAARGPDGHRWPWGDEWPKEDPKRPPRFCNWGGRIVDPTTFKTALVSASDERASLGWSWVGAAHMIGNVGEWTSSWFDAYVEAPEGVEHQNTGTFVKVIRGGTANDQDAIALRAAARNFIGRGIEAPPVPQNRFEFVGFRCSQYTVPGLDRVHPVLVRTERGRRFHDEDADLSRAIGADAPAVEPRGPVRDGVHVQGRTMSVVWIPARGVFHSESRATAKDFDDLLDFGIEDPVVLGALHTDLVIDRVLLPGPTKAPPPGTRRRRRPEPVETVPGQALPGTYLLGFKDRRLALVTPTFETVAYLTEPLARDGPFRLEAGAPEEPHMVVDPAADLVTFRVDVPLRADEPGGRRVRGTVALRSLPGGVAVAGAWHTR